LTVEAQSELKHMPVSEAEDQTQTKDFVSNEDDRQDCEDSNVSETEGDTSGGANSEFEVEPEEEEGIVDPFADFTAELEKSRRQRARFIKREPMPESLGNKTENPIRAEDGNHIDADC
jgi:hypothetical protein